MSTPNPDDSQFEEFIEEPAPRRSSNRNFYVAVGILGFLTIASLVVMVIVATTIVPAQNAQRAQQAAQIYAANTATSIAATERAATEQFLLTPSATPIPTNTPVPTSTPVVAMGSPTPEQSLSPEDAAHTATIAAMLTQGAISGSGTPAVTVTPGGLPSTGIGDGDISIPMLVGLAVLFVAIIFFVRKLRLSNQN